MLAALGEALFYLLAGLAEAFLSTALGEAFCKALASWYVVIPLVCLMVGAGTWLFLEGSRGLGPGVWCVGVFIGLMRLFADHANDDGA